MVAWFDPDLIDHGVIRINFWFEIAGYFLAGLFAHHASTIAAPGCRCIDTLVLHRVLSWIIEREGNWGVLALTLITNPARGRPLRRAVVPGGCHESGGYARSVQNLNRIVLIWNRLLQSIYPDCANPMKYDSTGEFRRSERMREGIALTKGVAH